MTKGKWSMEAFINISLAKIQCSKMTCLEWSQNLICHLLWKWCLQASSCYWNLNSLAMLQTLDLNSVSQIFLPVHAYNDILKQNTKKSAEKKIIATETFSNVLHIIFITGTVGGQVFFYFLQILCLYHTSKIVSNTDTGEAVNFLI